MDYDDREGEPVQIDLYGVRLHIRPQAETSTHPKSWREVWESVHAHLRAIVTDAFGLIGDTLKGARSLVRGIGLIPRSLASRIDTAHDRADLTEQQLREEGRPPDVEATLRELATFLRKKQVQGFTVRLVTGDEGLAICFLPPTDDKQALSVLNEATAQLMASHMLAEPLMSHVSGPKKKRSPARTLSPEHLQEVLSKPIEELDISVRAANLLKNARIGTIGDLVQRTERDMLSVKNFGRKSLDEITDVLDSLGLSLGMTVQQPPSP